MTLNFISTTIQKINTLILILFILQLTFLVNINVDYLDFYSRIQGNDFFTNVLYLLWTNSWYLYPFLLIYYSIIWIYNHKTGSNLILHCIICSYFLLSFLEITHYWSLNNYTVVLDLQSLFFNQLLSNSINKFHPFIFYYTLLSLLVHMYQSNIFTSYVFKDKNFLYSKSLFSQKSLQISLYLLTTLYLGSWWALQEGSWGGWWNWDPSEVFGLVILYCFLWLTHNTILEKNLKFKYYVDSIFLYTVVLIYSFIQLNFRLVSHNFGTKVVWFIDTDQFNFFILCVIIFLLVKLCLIIKDVYSKLGNFSNKFTKTLTPTLHIYTKVLFYTLLITQISLSFSVLVNDFMWKFYKINILNTTSIFSINLVVILLILYFIVNLLRFTRVSLFINIMITPQLNLHNLLLNNIILSLKKINIYHFKILLIISVGYLISSTYINKWGLINSWDVNQSIISLNSVNIDVFVTNLQNTYISDIVHNFIKTSETTESVKSFSLLINTDFLYQLLITNSGLNNFVINIQDSLTNTLNILFIISIYLTGSHLLKMKIIQL